MQAKIILIDDDPETLNLLTHFFEDLDFEVQQYSDALKAFADIASSKVRADVIVTDLLLPSISGIEFTKRIMTLKDKIPIILITANSKIEVAVEAIRAGAYDFVVKPINLSQLQISVERALRLNRIKKDNTTLKSVLALQDSPNQINGIIGKSPEIRQVLNLVSRVAQSNANVLISGESGTGKEVIAKAIHAQGPRKKFPFIAINCSAIPENLLESELFGHAKGSFTGASEKKIGLFEEADAGTLFLDEIGDLMFPLQAKLLRVLQEKKIRRVGENIDRPIRARIISATHKNLREEVELKSFREDLYFRLNVIPIWIPPLRERKDDILPLAEFFLNKYSVLNNLQNKRFSKDCLKAMLTNHWQGNIRELENSIERGLTLCESDTLEADDIFTIDKSDSRIEQKSSSSFDFSNISADHILSIEELNNQYVSYVLNLNHGIKETTAELRHQGNKTPIIALTAHAMKTERQYCLANGFDDHLSKPINRNLLIQRITSLLRPEQKAD